MPKCHYFTPACLQKTWPAPPLRDTAASPGLATQHAPRSGIASLFQREQPAALAWALIVPVAEAAKRPKRHLDTTILQDHDGLVDAIALHQIGEQPDRAEGCAGFACPAYEYESSPSNLG
jgi:hypothetical protein